MKYYAATLRGESPSCISTIYQFDSESELNSWIEDEMVAETYPRIHLSPKVARIVVKSTLRKVKVKWTSAKDWATNLTTFAGDWKYKPL